MLEFILILFISFSFNSPDIIEIPISNFKNVTIPINTGINEYILSYPPFVFNNFESMKIIIRRFISLQFRLQCVYIYDDLKQLTEDKKRKYYQITLIMVI